MPNLSSSPAAQFFTLPFRWRKQSYELNPPDPVYNVIYLGNVLTILGKGEASVDRPLSVIWKTYNAKKQRREIAMKLRVTRSGLKVETKQLGLTEYWAHRLTFVAAPSNYPRVFCWVYKHEGKKMRPELRCHAVLCKKVGEPEQIATNMQIYLQAALQEYKREKLSMERSRKNSLVSGYCPRRKMLLHTGSLNFRPPVSQSKSAPRLGSIDEEDEIPEPTSLFGDIIEEEEEFSDLDSLNYRTTPMLGGARGGAGGSLSTEDDPEEEDSSSVASSSGDSSSNSGGSCSSMPSTVTSKDSARSSASSGQLESSSNVDAEEDDHDKDDISEDSAGTRTPTSSIEDGHLLQQKCALPPRIFTTRIGIEDLEMYRIHASST